MPEAFMQSLLPRLLDSVGEEVLDLARQVARLDRDLHVRVDRRHLDRALKSHLQAVQKWASEIPGVSLGRSRKMDSAFEDLDLTVTPLRFDSDYIERSLPVSDLAGVQRHLIILGEPGAGKTTSLKRVCLDSLRASVADAVNPPPLPILVAFRDIRLGETVSQKILRSIGLNPDDSRVLEQVREKLREDLQTLTVGFLERTNALILMDGLDELQPGLADVVVKDIRDMLLRLGEARVIVSCRTAAFIYNFDHCDVLEICPLSDPQIRSFADKWLGHEQGAKLLDQISATPYHGTEIRPLLLGLLCTLYEKKGSIPDKPRNVYGEMVKLLLMEWDEQRSVRRYSEYADFSIDQKKEFLARLAYEIIVQLRRLEFTHDDLERLYRRICDEFGLPRTQVRQVTREIQSHTGLIISTGHDLFSFAHKSFHEYFCGYYLAFLPELPRQRRVMQAIPVECAVTVAMSTNASRFFAHVVRRGRLMDASVRMAFLSQFLSRIVIELPRFGVDPELGLAYIEVYTFLLKSLASPDLQSHVKKVLQELSQLAENRSVRSSVRQFVNCCSTERTENPRILKVLWDDDYSFSECAGDDFAEEAFTLLATPLFVDESLLADYLR